MTTNYANVFNPSATPQSEPIPGSTQVANSGGGFSWAVDDWERMLRFLVLGSEGGTYYIGERKLTLENANATLKCIVADPGRAIELICRVSEAGRAPKNDPAIFAMALACSAGNQQTRWAALDNLFRVVRIGTHLFQFLRDYETLRPAGPKKMSDSIILPGQTSVSRATGRYGRGVRRRLAKWFMKPADNVAFQAVKYARRHDWSQKDALVLTHPKAPSIYHANTYEWIMRGTLPEDHTQVPKILEGFEKLKAADNVKDVIQLISDYKLPREAVEQTQDMKWLKEPAVWEALLYHQMPLGTMVRQLGQLTHREVLKPMNAAVAHVVKQLKNAEQIKRSRLHPIALLTALMAYQVGHGQRAKMRGGDVATWTPIQQIVDALDEAFYMAFDNVTSTGKRIMYALDVSGSMGGGVVAGVDGLTPRIASAAMALVLARTEPTHMFTCFSTNLMPLGISPRMRLDGAIDKVSGIPFGGTDCSLPMSYAQMNKLDLDAFVVLTDAETWAGNIHPAQALKKYRAARGIPAKLVVVGMVSNGFTIADPNDAGMLDVVGFDTAAPTLMSDFIAR